MDSTSVLPMGITGSNNNKFPQMYNWLNKIMDRWPTNDREKRLWRNLKSTSVRDLSAMLKYSTYFQKGRVIK